MKEFAIDTSSKTQFIDVTHMVERAVKEADIKEGIGIVYCPHTTAAVTINENADPDVVRDISYFLTKILPADTCYKHMEGNSDAHIKSSLLGNSVSFIINGGKLVLGRWQGIYFCEFDGPRKRRFYVKVISG